MDIGPAAEAGELLTRIGYYRLSGYWYPLRQRTGRLVLEDFRPGVTLGQAHNLYVFDKRLRLLFLDGLERLEIALRVDVALSLGMVGPFAHRSAANFNSYFNEVDSESGNLRHDIWLSRHDDTCARSREDFAKHFRSKYHGPFPIWMAVELWEFGTLLHVLNGLKDKQIQSIADKYGIPRRTMLISWIQCLNFVRNVCAHHGRLWNRPLISQPARPRQGELPLMQHTLADPRGNARVYAAAAVLQFMLRTICPRSAWCERLKGLVSTFPSAPGASSIGFPSNWAAESLWSTPG